MAYRARAGIDSISAAIAVVVQAMVTPDVSGVMFTQNPVSGATEELYITASYGLGETVVGGLVTPDTFILRRDGTMVERVMGAKARRIVAAGAATREEAVESADRARFCLGDDELRALARLASAVVALTHAPQDIEWAFQRGKAVPSSEPPHHEQRR